MFLKKFYSRSTVLHSSCYTGTHCFFCSIQIIELGSELVENNPLRRQYAEQQPLCIYSLPEIVFLVFCSSCATALKYLTNCKKRQGHREKKLFSSSSCCVTFLETSDRYALVYREMGNSDQFTTFCRIFFVSALFDLKFFFFFCQVIYKFTDSTPTLVFGLKTLEEFLEHFRDFFFLIIFEYYYLHGKQRYTFQDESLYDLSLTRKWYI